MELIHIFVFAVASLPFMWLVPATWRPWGILVGTLLALAWIPGSDGLTTLEFLLSSGAVLFTVLVWWVVQPPDHTHDPRPALVLIGAVLALVWGVHLVTGQGIPVPVTLAMVAVMGVSAVSLRQVIPVDQASRFSLVLVGVIIVVLIVIKFPPLADYFGYSLDWDAEGLVTANPFVWLGFSYIAFRLMAILFDHRAGRLPKQGFALRDMAVYVLFFPAFTAGPIDRAQRFIPELNETKILDSARLIEGSTRIMVGVFKKFVVADSLALVAMSPRLIELTDSPAGLWLILYLYSFQIFFDFSGYSDVAIGLGRLYGITLPENFDRPYVQRNIQQFWQRWHITLSTWFRVYYFTPLSRAFIMSKVNFPQPFVIFFSQVTTMVLIGLWHGMTVNFLLWGVWHGFGLFVHKMLADNTRNWTKRVNSRLWSRRLMVGFSVFVTFHFVTLGWVFFALPEVSDSLTMLLRLFGV